MINSQSAITRSLSYSLAAFTGARRDKGLFFARLDVAGDGIGVTICGSRSLKLNELVAMNTAPIGPLDMEVDGERIRAMVALNRHTDGSLARVVVFPTAQ